MAALLALLLQVDVSKQVVILVNENVPASVTIGEYYAAKRGIPRTQICRVRAGSGETVTWPEARKTILEPLREFLKTRPDVLYIVPVYGVPVKTSEEKPENDGKGGDPYQSCVAGRDFACLDREIELLRQDHDLDGWIPSKTFKEDRGITLEDKVYIVSRLDGPSPESARALVDNALWGEAYGIEGTSFLDTRGLANDGSYGGIDQEMKQIKQVYKKYGLEYKHDDESTVVKLGTIPNMAHYWGWYTGDVVADPAFRFARGAVGAHLHSFSAGVLRSTNKTWTGPLVHHGITATCGTVYEPLSAGFPFGTIFLDRFFKGYTFGESMQMSNMYTSWQAVFVGDPLYAPYAKGMKEAQARNRKLANEGAAALEQLLDKGDLDGAQKLAGELARLPGGEFDFLLRELRARRLKPAKGTVAELRKALSDPRKALALSEYNFEANLAMGRDLLKKGSARAALEHFQRAAQVEPASSEALYFLGLAFKELKQLDDALKSFEAACAIDGHADAAREIGEICFAQKKFAEAVKRLEPALTRHPSERPLALLVARCHLALKDAAKAVTVLEAAVKEPPGGPGEVEAYAQCWELLLTANKGNKEKTDICAAIVAGLAARRKAGAKPDPIDAAIAQVAKDKTHKDLPALPTYDDKFIGLPTIYVANRTDWEITVFLSGPLAWTGSFRAIKGTTKPKTVELPAWPGKYRIVVVARKERDTQIFYGEAMLDLNKNYSLGVERDLRFFRADKP